VRTHAREEVLAECIGLKKRINRRAGPPFFGEHPIDGKGSHRRRIRVLAFSAKAQSPEHSLRCLLWKLAGIEEKDDDDDDEEEGEEEQVRTSRKNNGRAPTRGRSSVAGRSSGAGMGGGEARALLTWSV